MSWVYGWQWAQAAASQRAEIQQALGRNQRLLETQQARRAEIAAQASHALDELVAILLPSLDRAALARAAQLTGYTPLVAYDLPGARDAEERQLRARIAQIEADTRFVHREHLFAPRTGKLPLEVAELTEAKRSVDATLLAAEHPRLEHLLAVGYGTPDYAVPFWRLSYYTDWEAGDAILERFPGKTFAEVRGEVLRAREASATLSARIAELSAAIAAGGALVREHAQAVEALRTLDARHLARARQHLGRHIVDSGAQAIGPRLVGVPELEVLAKRVFGLAAKLTYLDRLAETYLLKPQAEMNAALAKIDRELSKYSRPKHAQAMIPAEKFHRRFPGKPLRWTKGWRRYQDAADTIYVFDRYDRGSFARDFLWWDLMTDGRIDGDFIPEIGWHRRHYPHRERRWGHDADRDVGIAAVGSATAFDDDHGTTPGILDAS